MRDHTKLRAFELADKLALATYEQTRSFPREEVFGLTSQLRRAAVSIASNIVEGAARFSEAEYLRFLDTAYGSAREVEYQLGLAFRLGFLSEPSHRELSALSIETSRSSTAFCVPCASTDRLEPQQAGDWRPEAVGCRLAAYARPHQTPCL